MKIRHYLFVILTAVAVSGLVSNPPVGNLPFFTRLVGPSHVLAQQVGFVGWNNIHSAFVRADFTDANASGLQNIPDLQWGLPASQAKTFRIDCDLVFTQATNVADSFGIQFSVAPTNSLIGGIMSTNATAFASIAPATITGTSATAVVTGTPAVTSALYTHIGGFIEQASNATDSTVNISVQQGTAADVIVVKRDSGCVWHSMN